MLAHMGCGVSRPDPYPMPTKPAPPPVSDGHPGERHAFRRRHVPSSSSSPHASFDSETSFQSCVSFISDELLETSQVPSPTAPATRVGIGESASPRTPDRRPMTASRLPTRPAPPARARFGARAEVRFMTTSEKTAGGWTLVASASGGGVSAAFESDRDRPSALRGVDLVALRDALRVESMECTDGKVSIARLNACLHRIVPPASRASAATVSSLFAAVDSEGTGAVDVADLIAAASALCASPTDPTARMRVAFDACCDDDDVQSQSQSQSQDARPRVLSKRRLRTMLRGAVVAAAAAVFAHAPLNPGSDENDENVDPNGDANGGGGQSQSQNQNQNQNQNVVTLTCAGGGRVVAPRLTSSSGATSTAFRTATSIESYADALVDDLFATHDTDWVGAVTWNDAREYALGCAFLRAWFGLDRIIR